MCEARRHMKIPESNGSFTRTSVFTRGAFTGGFSEPTIADIWDALRKKSPPWEVMRALSDMKELDG